MKLWRLTRSGHERLDGEGAMRSGGRYSSIGYPLVAFASEAGLAVLIAMRYTTECDWISDHSLGWTQTDAHSEQLAPHLDDEARAVWVDDWAASRRSLLISLPSAVLPEGQVILMNTRHPDAATLPPLTVRPFSFSQCLHRPPMLDRYQSARKAGVTS